MKEARQALKNATQDGLELAIEFLKLAQEHGTRKALEIMLDAGRINKAQFDELTKGA